LSSVESLESRRLFALAHVSSCIADNRGEVIFQMDQSMSAATINSTTVQMHTAGKDGKFGTIDDVKITGKVRYFSGNKRITFRTSALPVNTAYSMKLSGKKILSSDGSKLDGEFTGSGTTSGNGVGGGDYLMIARKTTSTQTARFSTVAGAFNVALDLVNTPKNAANFAGYANTAAYDGTFIHRSIPGFIVQGGGFNVTHTNQLGVIRSGTPVDNEPGPHNIRGTLALARPDDQNPATDDKGTNQWFFNLADNSSNLDAQNGGFTAFGTVTSAAGLAVMDAMAAYPIVDATQATGSQVFSDLPVQNSSITASAAVTDPGNSLVLIRRVAILDKVSAFA
jgi:cyclophilin family peptidyl-prolyl cis-trans isomerase